MDERLISPDDKIRNQALQKLATLTEEKKIALLNPLILALNNPESLIANRAAEALVIMGRPAISEVRRNISSSDVYVRISAIAILSRMGPQAQDAVPDLIACLKDPHPLVRDEAVFALGQMGMAAQAAGPDLLEAYKTADAEAQSTIAEALKKIGIPPPLPKSS
ncbi:MAG: hypothetical protein KCHDKBKB_01272 [Elusimicrobia bacterium]|nr:hypothetical protein [Elusimicrobiota bacterium]